jgi:hypothetical protein
MMFDVMDSAVVYPTRMKQVERVKKGTANVATSAMNDNKDGDDADGDDAGEPAR